VTIVAKPGPSTAISFGVPMDVLRGSRDFYALSIARSWLGEHRNSFSHLYQVIREARGLNYGDYAYIEKFPRGGQLTMPPTGAGRRAQLFEVWIRPVQEKNGLFALRAALREVEALTEKGMTKEQFEAARKFLRKYALHFAETTEDRLGYAVDDRFYGIPATPGHLAKFRAMMDELTLEDVNTAIRKHWKLDNLRIAIVTEHADALRDALVKGDPSPCDYGAESKAAEILEEDKAIASHPLRIPASNVQVVPVEKMFAK
jgi:zinc protease